MLNVLLWIVVGLQVWGALSNLAKSGKPGAVSGGVLAAVTILSAFMIVVTTIAAILI